MLRCFIRSYLVVDTLISPRAEHAADPDVHRTCKACSMPCLCVRDRVVCPRDFIAIGIVARSLFERAVQFRAVL